MQTQCTEFYYYMITENYRHCYGGLENCQALSPEVCVLLCYAAEKYMIASLKKKVADRLKPDCVSELFPALHCLVTYNISDLQQHITEVLYFYSSNNLRLGYIDQESM